MRYLLAIFLLLAVGCASNTSSPSLTGSKKTSQSARTENSLVEIKENTFIRLPKVRELQKPLSVTQLVSAKWGDKKTQNMVVQLEIDEQKVVFAGFSSWGAKLISLTYSDSAVESYVMAGLPDALPEPKMILMSLMLSMWPEEAWSAPLAEAGWKLKEGKLERALFDEKGKKVITINYTKRPITQSDIVFTHHSLNYVITIKTAH